MILNLTDLMSDRRDWYTHLEGLGMIQRPLHLERFIDQYWLDAPPEEEEE